MSACEIAAALGGRRSGGGWWLCRCPAHEDRCPSLSLRDGERGLIAHCHAGCERRDVLAALRRRGLLAGRSDAARPVAVTTAHSGDRDAALRTEWARRIWDAARDARGSPVARYLAGRGITLAPPLSLRWAPSLRRPDGTSGPAMVARIDDLAGELIGVLRTWLARDDAAGIWRRRDRAMLGRTAGGAVRLSPAGETLAVGEGVETTLAAMVATGLLGWAALSTSGLVALALPPEVRHVIILADHDRSGAGERAARAAAARWLAEGRRVRIALPPEAGTDMADMLAGRAAEVGDAAA